MLSHDCLISKAGYFKLARRQAQFKTNTKNFSFVCWEMLLIDKGLSSENIRKLIFRFTGCDNDSSHNLPSYVAYIYSIMALMC